MSSDTNFTMGSYPFASISRRFLALILDGLIIFFPCLMGSHLVPVVGGLIVWFFYFPILESSEMRATLGKYLVGIQVCDLSERRVSFRTALIRNVLKSISSFFLFLGYLFALFTQKKQTFHDLLADTIVVYGRCEKPISDAWVASIKQLFEFQTRYQPRNSFIEIEQLERLQTLRANGTLTEEEFQDQKRKILGRNSE